MRSKQVRGSVACANAHLRVEPQSHVCDLPSFRLGDLLVEAKVMSRSDIECSVEISDYLAIPLGILLQSTHRVTAHAISSALAVQKLGSKGSLAYSRAIAALRLAVSSGTSIEDALDNVEEKSSLKQIRLGEMLIEAGITDSEKLDDAFAMSNQKGIPIGQSLIVAGILWPELLESALLLQQKLVQGEITLKRALSRLRRGFASRVPVCEKIDPALTGLRRQIRRVEARELMSWAQLDVTSNRKAEANIIFEEAEKLARLTNSGWLTADEATLVLAGLGTAPLAQRLSSLASLPPQTVPPLHYHQLLALAGVTPLNFDRTKGKATHAVDVQGAFAQAQVHASELLDAGQISAKTYFASLRSYYLVCTGRLATYDAVRLLSDFASSEIDCFDDLLLCVGVHARWLLAAG